MTDATLADKLVTNDTLTSAVPVIATADVPASVRYFEEQLGFTQRWAWGEPPVYAAVRSGSVLLYICQDNDLAAAIARERVHPEIFIWVNDVERLYRQHRERNVEIVEELKERPWGAKQYVAREPNGYYLKFTEEASEPCS